MTRPTHALTFAFLIAGLTPTQAASQDALTNAAEKMALAQVPGVSVTVEDLSQGALRCGVQEATLATRVTKTLLDNSIRIDDSGKVPYLYVKLTAVALETICFASLEISLRTIGMAPLFTWAPEAKLFVMVLLYDKGMVLSDSPGRFADHVLQSVTEMTEAFAVAYRVAHQP